jgi:hypothetical protein
MKLSISKKMNLFMFLGLLLFSINLRAQDLCCPDSRVRPEDLNQYISNYNNLFRGNTTSKKIFTQWVFLQRNYFLFIDSFFNHPDNQSYKGVKFLLTDQDNIPDRDQLEHKNQLFFQISAAFTPNSADYSAFQFFDNTVDLLWRPADSRVYISPSSGGNPNPNTMITRFDLLRINTDAERRYLSKRPHPKYTKQIFVCKDVIKSIATDLKLDVTLGGVKCIFGSYNKPMPSCIGLEDIRQFTIIFAAVKDQNVNVKLAEYYKRRIYVANDGIKFIDNYNHGSLCPNVCNQ